MTEEEAWGEWTEEDYLGLEDVLGAWVPDQGDSQSEGERVLREAVLARDMSAYFRFTEQSTRRSDESLSFEEVLSMMARSSDLIVGALADHYGSDPKRMVRALEAYIRFKDRISAFLGGVYAEAREEALRKKQRAVVRELSTPVIEVWEGILVMPLIGVLDSARAKQMTEQLLDRISNKGSRVVILDVTGVSTVDTEVANHLMRTMQAARLVGAATVLVGISPQVAQTLVHLNVTFPGLYTASNLRAGLARAFSLLGREVVATEAEA